MTFSEALEEMKKGKVIKHGNYHYYIVPWQFDPADGIDNGWKCDDLEILSNDWEIAP